MGACHFSRLAEGRDPGEAFSNAVAEARHEYGNSGYTGSVAEKSSFLLLDPAIEAQRFIRKYEAKLPRYTVAHQRQLAQAITKARQARDYRAQDALEYQLVYRKVVYGPLTSRQVSVAEACAAERKKLREQIRRLRLKGSGRSYAVAHAMAVFEDPR